jgi:NAD(P)-dependent dehydrogenase (short-subunit alcohol dehydrogenase family)
LGLEFVRQYAADGWDVIATAREPERATQLWELQRGTGKIEIHKLDIADEKSVKALASAMKAREIDILLLNSGIYARGGTSIGEIDYGAWREAIETNLFGPIRLTEALLENVAASKTKLVAVISSSMASLRGVQDGGVAMAGTAYQYRTSKTAVNMAMSIVAKELESRGISAVIIDPGWVKTDMGGPHAHLTPEQSITGMRKLLSRPAKELSGKFMGYDGLARQW